MVRFIVLYYSILFVLYHDFYKRYVSGFFIDMYHCFCDSSVLLILWSHRSIHCIVRAYGIILSMPHIHVTVLMGGRDTPAHLNVIVFASVHGRSPNLI